MNAPPLLSTSETPLPELAVIIPHFQDYERLKRCLRALADQVDERVDVLVVDNGSLEPIEPIFNQFPFCRYVVEGVRSAAVARNRGVDETSAELIAFTDADCVPSKDWILRARAHHLSDSVAGGPVDVFDETAKPRTGAQAFETEFAFHQETYIRKKGFAVTANIVTSRTIFERVGPFRPGLSEDRDWCQRAVRLGIPLTYDPSLLVRHPSRNDWPALKRKWHRITTEAFCLERANGSGLVKWAAKALFMPAWGAFRSLQLLLSDKLEVREKLKGVATVLRLTVWRMVWMVAQVLRGAISPTNAEVGAGPLKTK